MKVSKKSLFVLLLVVIFAASCAGQPPAETPDINASLTAGVGTFAAYFMQTQTAMYTPATETPTPTLTVTATPTSLTPSPTAIVFSPVLSTPGFIPVVTITGTNYTRTAAPVASGCNNLQLLTDFPITSSGLVYTKSWKVANVGTCDWTAGYHFVRVSGTVGPERFGVRNYPVEPGKWQTYQVSFEVSTRRNTYSASWQLADASGNRFGSVLTLSVSYP